MLSLLRRGSALSSSPLQHRWLSAASEQPQSRIRSLEIIFEDSHYFFVNKPADISVAGDEGEEGETFHRLVTEFSVRNYKWRPTLLHRLDKGVSGIMCYGKHKEAERAFKQRLEKKQAIKFYVACLEGVPRRKHGELTEKEGTKIRARITKHSQNLNRYVISSREGETVMTTLQVLKILEDPVTKKKWSLVSMRPFTGRRHQLRASAAELRAPIIGDKLYGGPKAKRIMLHAIMLGFSLPQETFEQFADDASMKAFAALTTGIRTAPPASSARTDLDTKNPESYLSVGGALPQLSPDALPRQLGQFKLPEHVEVDESVLDVLRPKLTNQTKAEAQTDAKTASKDAGFLASRQWGRRTLTPVGPEYMVWCMPNFPEPYGSVADQISFAQLAPDRQWKESRLTKERSLHVGDDIPSDFIAPLNTRKGDNNKYSKKKPQF